MKIYKNSEDRKFIESITRCLDFDNLCKSSVTLTNPTEKYKKQCCFDFSGISALLLHDEHQSTKSTIKEQFKNIFILKNEFEKRRIRLHLRFLLVYPYGAHAISRIQAERSKNRATINEQKLDAEVQKRIDNVESWNENIFTGSNFLSRQKGFLKFISGLMSEYKIDDSGDHRLVIRFTPTAVNVCMYRINGVIYFSPYLLAKQSNYDPRCVNQTPITEISRTYDRYTFEAMLDHFRYLWGLPQAIYLQDATDFSKDMPEGAEIIKPPSEIDYKCKARILNDKLHRKGTLFNPSSWQTQVKYLLSQLCPEIPKIVPSKEQIFISCSWDEKNEPHLLGRKLKSWLVDDLKENTSIVIVESKPGDWLTQNIYDKLKSSTVGIILLTADIEDKGKNLLSRPNIYHEIGYLMATYSLKGHGNNKVIPILQTINDVYENKIRTRTVKHPSNISDVTRIPLKDYEIEVIYPLIIRTLSELLTSISVRTLCRALYSHRRRILDLLEAKKLNTKYAKNCLQKIKREIDDLRHEECTFYPCTEYQRTERVVTDYDVVFKSK